MRAPCAYQSRRASRTGAKAAGSRLVATVCSKGAMHGRGHRTTAWVVLAEARCNTPNTTITRRVVPSGFCSEGPESRQAKATQTFSERFVDEPQQQRRVSPYRPQALERRRLAKLSRNEERDQLLRIAETWNAMANEREARIWRGRDKPGSSHVRRVLHDGR